MRIDQYTDEQIWRMKFGDKLKRLIHIRNMTQGQVAIELGVTDATLSGYINGTHIPNGYKIQQMANILNCDVNALYDIDN